MRSMRSTPTGGRPLPAFGYTGSIRAPSSRHGTTRSISARNCARRVVLVYFSKPVPASVICLRAIITSRGRPLPVSSQHVVLKRERVIQRFPKSAYRGRPGVGDASDLVRERPAASVAAFLPGFFYPSREQAVRARRNRLVPPPAWRPHCLEKWFERGGHHGRVAPPSAINTGTVAPRLTATVGP